MEAAEAARPSPFRLLQAGDETTPCATEKCHLHQAFGPPRRCPDLASNMVPRVKGH
jgi:hypothetical protein